MDDKKDNKWIIVTFIAVMAVAFIFMAYYMNTMA